MPLRLDVKRKLSARSDRVKCVDVHPTEPWLLASLYNGNIHVWNHESQTLVKSFEVTDLPVRAGKFVARKNWVVTGSDDMMIRVFNYNTLEKTHGFEAHSDYVRSLQVHPTQPYLLSSSDDMTIKLWDWDKKWQCIQVFEGHTHYVMQIVINPKDNNQFASASLDRSIKVWQLGSNTPNFTLEGHEKGVNCIDYFHGGEKPYLVSGADDRTVKIWDYQNKNCVQTLDGHAQNVSAVIFHPELPVILSGSEDGTVRIWHANTYRLESTLNYGMERVWTMSCLKGSNSVAIGYDEGSIMVKLGREEPAMSMDSSGKILCSKHSEILQANLKGLGDAEVKDGERLPLAIKEMGSCEIYPQTLSHNPNGRFVVVCGDGEYIIYTAMALRNKSFGSAQEFVWAADSSEYAIRDGNKVKIFKNFKEKKSFKPEFGAENIYGGHLLGVRAASGLSFYDWDTTELIRRIEIQPKSVFWSENGELCCIATEESFFILFYHSDAVSRAMDNKDELVTEDGVEDAFEVLGEIEEVIKTGVWVGDCFIYTNSVNRLNYYVGGEIVTISHLDRSMYLLGYLPKENRLYLADKELNVISYSLLLSVLEYQTAVMRKDFETAKAVLPTIPKEQRNRVAHFLEKQGFKQQALAVSCDPEHRFELAIQIGDLQVAKDLAVEADSEQKWKQLAELAIQKCQFALAQECLFHAQDYAGLLLLASCSGDAVMMTKLAIDAEKNGKYNVAFLAYFSLGRVEDSLELLCKSNRLPEAAFLARTYLPNRISDIVKMWKENLGQTNQKAADSLADPMQYENLFPDLQEAIQAEKHLEKERKMLRPANDYKTVPNNLDRNAIEEMKSAPPIDELTQPIMNLVLADFDEGLSAVPSDDSKIDEPLPPQSDIANNIDDDILSLGFSEVNAPTQEEQLVSTNDSVAASPHDIIDDDVPEYQANPSQPEILQPTMNATSPTFPEGLTQEPSIAQSTDTIALTTNNAQIAPEDDLLGLDQDDFESINSEVQTAMLAPLDPVVCDVMKPEETTLGQPPIIPESKSTVSEEHKTPDPVLSGSLQSAAGLSLADIGSLAPTEGTSAASTQDTGGSGVEQEVPAAAPAGDILIPEQIPSASALSTTPKETDTTRSESPDIDIDSDLGEDFDNADLDDVDDVDLDFDEP